MWTSTKDLVKENLAEIGHVKDSLSELATMKEQIVQIKSEVESLRGLVDENQKTIKDLLRALKKDQVKCLDLLCSDDMFRRVEKLNEGQGKMASAMQEVLRNVSLLDDGNRLILANLLLKEMNV